MSKLTFQSPYHISLYNEFVRRMENVALSLKWLLELSNFSDVPDKQSSFRLSLEYMLELDLLRNDIKNSIGGALITEQERVCKKLISGYIDTIKETQNFLQENLHRFPESERLQTAVRMNYSDTLTLETIEKSSRNECRITIDDIDIKYNSFAVSILPTLYRIRKEISSRKKPKAKIVQLSDLFNDLKQYKKILTILAENDPRLVDPVSLVWIDKRKGYKGQIIKILKDLNRKGYYTKKIEVKNEIYQLISLNTFGVKISMDSFKKVNETFIQDKEVSFIPYAKDL